MLIVQYLKIEMNSIEENRPYIYIVQFTTDQHRTGDRRQVTLE